jgi:hypothetical protein
MSVYTSNDDELCCPLCGDTNTHLDEVAIAARPSGEDGPILAVGINSRGAITHRPGIVPGSRRVGQGRRHRFALIGWCESCDGRFALLFTQHKGVTLTESIDLMPHTGRTDGPIPLRQGPPPSRLGSLIPGVLRDLVARHSRGGAA